MPSISQHEVVCPSCGAEESVSLRLDQRGHSGRFVEGKAISRRDQPVQVFIMRTRGICCNAVLLYHDMTHQFCVQFYPFESLKDADFLQRFRSDGTLRVGGLRKKMLGYIAKPHIVFSLKEMLHYILFRERIAGMQTGNRNNQEP